MPRYGTGFPALQLKRTVAPPTLRIPPTPKNQYPMGALASLGRAQLHSDAPDLDQASRLLEAIATRSEDAFLRSWAQRQLVYAAYRQGRPESARQRLQALAEQAEDPALRREAQQLLD